MGLFQCCVSTNLQLPLLVWPQNWVNLCFRVRLPRVNPAISLLLLLLRSLVLLCLFQAFAFLNVNHGRAKNPSCSPKAARS